MAEEKSALDSYLSEWISPKKDETFKWTNPEEVRVAAVKELAALRREVADLKLILRYSAKKHGGYPFIPWAQFSPGEVPRLSTEARVFLERELAGAQTP